MAYVAISKQLVDDVRNTIYNKTRQEVDLIPNASKTIFLLAEDPWVMSLFWGEHEHLRAVLPEQWIKLRDDCRVKYKWQHVFSNGHAKHLEFQLEVHTHSGRFAFPPESDYTPHVELTSEQVVTAPPDVKERIEQVKNYIIERNEVDMRWTKVQTDVLNFLQSCKSLNEALKLWPDIRIYVPSQYLRKAEEATQKAKAAESRALEILKSIDTDGAVASAVMLRMRESSTQPGEVT